MCPAVPVIVGISVMKDEADICGQVCQHLLDQGVDHLIVADNLSSDMTVPILLSFGKRITLVHDSEVGYYQAAKMTALAHQAGAMGATWVIPFDADEFWSGISGLHDTDATVVYASTTAHLPNGTLEQKPLPKVAFRYCSTAELEMGNHNVHGVPGKRAAFLTIDEYQYRSWEQFRRKVRQGKAAYDATVLPDYYGAHWRTLGAMTDEQLAKEWEAMSA